MRNKKTVLIIVITLFILILFFIKYSEVHLKKHHVLLNAKTIEWAVSAKMGLNLKYEFLYNGKKIISSNAFEKFRGNKDFENRYFPVMYDPELESSQLLIEPSDFKIFDLPYPDSLKWVLGYIK